jgi:hypothetical protein
MFSLPAILLVVVGAGCGNSVETAKAAADKTKWAIERVLRADEKLYKEGMKLAPNAAPSHLARAIGVYCDGLDQLDMSDCPADFRVAYRQHVRAWREAQAVVKGLPEGFLQGVFMGVFNALLRGEADGGRGRLEGDLKHAMERVRTTWEEVEKTGAKYGAA